jgi:hypothetical protein
MTPASPLRAAFAVAGGSWLLVAASVLIGCGNPTGADTGWLKASIRGSEGVAPLDTTYEGTASFDLGGPDPSLGPITPETDISRNSPQDMTKFARPTATAPTPSKASPHA